jgi:hypothetical protein
VRQLELAALEPLVDEDEAALVPREDLNPVAPARDEDEEVAGVRVLRELVLHDCEKAIDRLPHVYRRRADEDADGARDGEHGLQRRGEGPQVREIGSRREPNPRARRERQLEKPATRRAFGAEATTRTGTRREPSGVAARSGA